MATNYIKIGGTFKNADGTHIAEASQLLDTDFDGGKFQSAINKELSELHKGAADVLEFCSVNYIKSGEISPGDPFPQINLGNGNYHYVISSSEGATTYGVKKLSVFTTYVCAADFGLNYYEGEAYRAKEPASAGGNWSLVRVASNGTKDYLDLENKPTLNGEELNGDMAAADLGLAELANTVTMEVTYDDTSTATFHVVVNPYAQEAAAASLTPDEEEGGEHGG
ncbi:MAG: hypothetical protein HUK01_07155 [Bacteroidaceae bacterium]|nr:hypothetical protein [Bacteroidaceae bacterium]